MEVHEALRRRNSARAFLPDPVSEELLREVIALSFEAPSWSNVQPYRLALATGEPWRAIGEKMMELARTTMIAPEIPWPLSYPSPYKERRGATGYGLYGLLGIAREDRAAREVQFMKNYNGFGAPAAVFLFVERRLGEYAVLDAGCWLMALLLAAQERGLATIAQAALAGYPAVVREYFEIPDNLALLGGVALGYADPTAVVNQYRPKRTALDEILLPPRTSGK